MTFLEAALEILKRERKPLHFKDLTERAIDKKLLTFVGRTPEVTMQTQLTTAIKKAPGNPFVRVKPGVFGLLRYPTGPLPVEPEAKPSTPRDDRGGREPLAAIEGPASARSKDQARDPRTDGGGLRVGRGRRRRRGGRGRDEGRPTTGASSSGETKMSENGSDRDDSDSPDELELGSLSPEARAAALAETGVLESSDDDGDGDDLMTAPGAAVAAGTGAPSQAAQAEGDQDVAGGEGEEGQEGQEGEEGEEGDDEPVEGTPGAPGLAAGADREDGFARRRRRRRRRGGANGREETAPGLAGAGGSSSSGASMNMGASLSESGPSFESRTPTPYEALAAANAEAAAGGGEATAAAPRGEVSGADGGQGVRRIMTPIDAAIEILRGQTPGRGVHVRQIADAAIRRRLIHGEPNEAWRVMRAALAAEPKERLRAGQRPRVRPAGSGLFALARRPPDLDLEKAEYVFGEARRALRERTVAGLEQRLSELAPGAFEALARVLLQREGFGPATFVKRVESTVYVEALRGRGARSSRCLIALRPGNAPAGRRVLGELRAGIKARGQDEGLLMMAGRLAEDGVAEWRDPGSPLEVADGPALAETCIRHGVGIINSMVSVDFVDADFFAELSEG